MIESEKAYAKRRRQQLPWLYLELVGDCGEHVNADTRAAFLYALHRASANLRFQPHGVNGRRRFTHQLTKVVPQEGFGIVRSHP